MLTEKLNIDQVVEKLLHILSMYTIMVYKVVPGQGVLQMLCRGLRVQMRRTPSTVERVAETSCERVVWEVLVGLTREKENFMFSTDAPALLETEV